MTVLPLAHYVALGHTTEEIALLREHDAGETLHAYVGCPGFQVGGAECECPYAHYDNEGACQECGDDSSGLMHNNTWRNVEPLMED